MEQNYNFFIKTNLDEYISEWIAICENQVVAHGTNPKDVFRKAKEKYPKKRIMLTRVAEKETMIF